MLGYLCWELTRRNHLPSIIRDHQLLAFPTDSRTEGRVPLLFPVSKLDRRPFASLFLNTDHRGYRRVFAEPAYHRRRRDRVNRTSPKSRPRSVELHFVPTEKETLIDSLPPQIGRKRDSIVVWRVTDRTRNTSRDHSSRFSAYFRIFSSDRFRQGGKNRMRW